MQVDVAIVGAGPGGGNAACRLAESGLRVALLERRELPRHKPCGGALPARVRDLLDWDFSPLVEATVSARRHLFRGDEAVTKRHDDAPILFVDRSRFDMALVERALERSRGAVALRQRFEVRGVDEDKRGVTVRARGGDVVRAALLVAADGPSSPCARALGLSSNAPRPAAAVDVEIEVAPRVFRAERRRATFDWHAVPGGYGWLFPKRDVLSAGVALWQPAPIRLLSECDDFLARSLPRGAIRRVVRRAGHPVPLFGGHRPLATARSMLVGDAAGLVDPVLGEGISHALESGLVAAEVACRLLGAPAKPLPADGMTTPEPDALLDLALSRLSGAHAYTDVIRHGLGRALNLIRLVTAARFFGDPESFFTAVSGRPAAPR